MPRLDSRNRNEINETKDEDSFDNLNSLKLLKSPTKVSKEDDTPIAVKT